MRGNPTVVQGRRDIEEEGRLCSRRNVKAGEKRVRLRRHPGRQIVTRQFEDGGIIGSIELAHQLATQVAEAGKRRLAVLPGGRVEIAILAAGPVDGRSRVFWVLHGGDMQSYVTGFLFQFLRRRDVATLRFNFRGVGRMLQHGCKQPGSSGGCT